MKQSCLRNVKKNLVHLLASFKKLDSYFSRTDPELEKILTAALDADELMEVPSIPEPSSPVAGVAAANSLRQLVAVRSTSTNETARVLQRRTNCLARICEDYPCDDDEDDDDDDGDDDDDDGDGVDDDDDGVDDDDIPLLLPQSSLFYLPCSHL